MARRLRLIAYIALLLLVAPAARQLGQMYNEAENRRDRPYPERAEIVTAWQNAMRWVDANRETILASENQYLWEYMFIAADLSQDQQLLALAAEYRARYLTPEYSRTFLSWFLDKPGNIAEVFPAEEFASLADYDKAMVYSRACRADMRTDPTLLAMHRADYCNDEILKNRHSSCINHQMKGISYIQSTGCPPAVDADLDKLMLNLQGQTHSLLQTDAQVSEVFIQRILLLYYTGAPDLVRPNWLHRVLEQQQPDGGWLPYQRVMPLLPGVDLGFGWRGLFVHRKRTTFHTTSIAIFVLAHMLRDSEQSGS